MTEGSQKEKGSGTIGSMVAGSEGWPQKAQGRRGAEWAGGGVPRRRGSRGASGAEGGRLRGCGFRRGFTGAARPGYTEPSHTEPSHTKLRHAKSSYTKAKETSGHSFR